jgi:Tfp pilus assembly protein PilF
MERIEKLKALLKETPGDSFVQHALALEYIKLNNDSEARRIFEGLLERDEDYVGSYYHLAKLLERNHEKEAALHWYERGMKKAKEKGDRHAFNELQSAYEDLSDQ